jgi:beta-xylosidase
MVAMHFTNPVYEAYFADPFVWRHGHVYYAIGTGPADAAGRVACSERASVFPLLASNDLASWSFVDYALIRPDPRLGDTFWAPEIVAAEGRWLLYYSVGHADRGHQLRVAAGADPLGPYVDIAQLTDPNEVAFAIDPHPFRDSDGRWYLFHARDFLDLVDGDGTPVRAGTALVVQPLATMTRLAPGAVHTVARARFDWQRFAANRPMYGSVFDWHTLEGPFVVKQHARYYCLYSAGCWQTQSYGVDYVVADAVLGPYTDEGAASGPRVLESVPEHVQGPGHCSVVTTPRGQAYLAYHAWTPSMDARRLHIDALELTEAGPRSSGPTWTPQPVPGAAHKD